MPLNARTAHCGVCFIFNYKLQQAIFLIPVINEDCALLFRSC